ncbi:1,4-alpha-glucan branching protein GlgB [Catenisphaera adipataccumulans]|jgi:1,4-alpha-glucan branching enzyme|uniref:1,4-alpha-glucan branching enzyme n=1 Tax=Catenisphaera adipataccumulans TaxID=700500 RepID=A0A7W8CXH6_9FIRM|nr:1,4-alpha-glucan branching protein GlgB [Catenisphaera adipataccumulans]MBB5183396.1 1,4-alpha-glucan branching enzyme [Catenisphaera adipataccumulans]
MDHNKTKAFFEGRELHAYNLFGAHVNHNSVDFSVYAPNAQWVSVIGTCNDWDEDAGKMQKDDQGIWTLNVQGAKAGDHYKYRVCQKDGTIVDKMDPYAFYSELRPNTASIVSDLTKKKWTDKKWLAQRNKGFDRPVNIYEMHIGSWKIKEGLDEDEFMHYGDIVDDLIAHCKKHNFTHVEVMPLCEYPFDGSWGYQCTGYFSSTSRFGTNQELMDFVDKMHANNIGVIMDFVPVHFVKDNYALANFDGTHLYEYEKDSDANSEWGTCYFDLWKESVRSFLMSAANFWIDVYHFDGLRMDAISNAIYWHGNKNNGRNDGACDFMKRMNFMLNDEWQGKIMLIAEDSTDFPNVTKSTFDDGLDFDYKWDMGWMNDTLNYLKKDPIYRQWHHYDVTFSMAYFYSEKFMLTFSHDEVVHGKATIVDKMWGSYEDKFAQARALYTYMYTHPGKKLNFMGNEIGQLREWDEKKSCDWFLLEYPMHDAFEHFIIDLGQMYVDNDAFWKHDYDGESFQWIDADNTGQNMFSYIRRGEKKDFVIVLNFSTNGYTHQQFGVPEKGLYKEIINTQWAKYNGNRKDNDAQHCRAVRLPRNNQPFMIEINVPPLGAVVFEVEK